MRLAPRRGPALRRARPGIVLLLSLALFAGCASDEEKAQRYFDKGMALLEQGDLVKARLELQNALQIRPNLAEAWYALAQIAERRGEWEATFAHLNSVLEIEPGHLQARVKRARLLLLSGQIEQALESSRQLLEEQARDPDVLALQAAVLLRVGDHAGAREYASAALASQPGHVDALAVQAGERLASGEAEAALASAEQGIAVEPGSIALRLLKIQALQSLSRHADVETVYRELIERYPAKRGLRASLARYYLQQGRPADAEAVHRAIVAANPGDFDAKLELIRLINESQGGDAAIDALQDLIEDAADDSELRFVLAALYRQQGADQLRPLLTELAASEWLAVRVRAKSMLAETLLEQGDEAGARRLIDEVLAEDPKNELAQLLKGSLAIDDGQYEAAIAGLREVLREAPDSARTQLLLARAHAETGQDNLAEYYFAEAFRAGGQAPRYGLPYVRYLLRADNALRARSILDDLLHQAPDNREALTLLARMQLAQGDLEGAQRSVDRLRAARDVAVDELVGAIEAGRKNYEASIEAYRRAYAADAGDSALIALVRAYVGAGRGDDAARFLRKVVSANPANSGASLLLGRLYLYQRNFEQAEATFRDLLSRDPANQLASLSLSQLLVARQRVDEALVVLDQGLAAGAGSFSLRIAKAALYQRQGRYDQAVALYEQLLRERPDADVVANNLANLLVDHGNDAEGFRRANKLAQRFEESAIADFRDTLGWTCLQLGDGECARRHLQAAVSMDPGEAIFRYHLGLALLASDDRDAARRELEKALALLGERSPGYRTRLEQELGRLRGDG